MGQRGAGGESQASRASEASGAKGAKEVKGVASGVRVATRASGAWGASGARRRTLKNSWPRRAASTSTSCSGTSALCGAKYLKSSTMPCTIAVWLVIILPMTCSIVRSVKLHERRSSTMTTSPSTRGTDATSRPVSGANRISFSPENWDSSDTSCAKAGAQVRSQAGAAGCGRSTMLRLRRRGRSCPSAPRRASWPPCSTAACSPAPRCDPSSST